MKIFIDTNILIYALDNSDQIKHDLAVISLQRILEKETAFTSTQILSELYVNITRKVKNTLSLDDATDEIRKLIKVTTVLPVEFETILKSIEIQKQYKFSFWDSLVVASAKLANIDRLLTEDLHHGQNIDGMVIVNPFNR